MIIDNSIFINSPYLDKFLTTQSLIYQTPAVVQYGDSVLHRYGFNDTGFLPPYSIEHMIGVEILFCVLDCLESIKYGNRTINAKTLIFDNWIQRKDALYLNDGQPNYFDLKYIIDFFNKYRLKPVNTISVNTPYYPRETFTLKNTPYNSHIKNLANKFLSKYDTSLVKLGLYKNNKRYMIPIYSGATFLQKFAFENMGKEEKALINSKNILNKSEFENMEIPCAAVMYWQYYKNTRFLQLNKQRIIKYYSKLIFEPQLLYKICVDVCPELGVDFSDFTAKISSILEQIFFDDDILDKYRESEVPDYFIFVYQYLIKLIAQKIRYTPSEFQHNLKTLKEDILQLMNEPFLPLINPLIDRLLEKHLNNIDNAEKDLVAQLTSCIDFENHYIIPH